MSDLTFFPEFFNTVMPKPDVPMSGLRASVVSDKAQIIFYEIPDGSAPPEHVNCDEWGLVITGSVSLTMNGETKTYGAGESFFIPDGVPHRLVNHPGVIGISAFADPERFPVRR